MATLMFGKAVVTHLDADIKKIQSIEYKVYKHLIGVGGFVAVASLRSEIGSSKVITRLMETVILLAKDIWDGEFSKIKKYLETEIEKGKGNWIRRANTYMQTLNLSWTKIKEMTRTEIKAQIREWDTNTWKAEMMNMTTMKWYVEAKMRIRYDE